MQISFPVIYDLISYFYVAKIHSCYRNVSITAKFLTSLKLPIFMKPLRPVGQLKNVLYFATYCYMSEDHVVEALFCKQTSA